MPIKAEDLKDMVVMDFFDFCTLSKAMQSYIESLTMEKNENYQCFQERQKNAISINVVLCDILKSFQISKDIKNKVLLITILKPE